MCLHEGINVEDGVLEALIREVSKRHDTELTFAEFETLLARCERIFSVIQSKAKDKEFMSGFGQINYQPITLQADHPTEMEVSEIERLLRQKVGCHTAEDHLRIFFCLWF